MLQVDIKSLLLRLNKHSAGMLQKAAGICVSRSHYEITVEHLLLVLLENPDSEITLAVRHFDLDPQRLIKAIENSLEEFRAGNAGKPVFSPIMLELVQDAWMIASIELKETLVSSGALLLAILSRPQAYGRGQHIDLLLKARRDILLERFDDITGPSPERIEAREASGASGEGASVKPHGTDPLETFCEDFTMKAKQGKIDPVFGRDDEIRQIIDILARRRKNNPICVGEPGVGKTAVIEGLALRIVEQDVPDMLRDVRILGLDLGLLQAGAGIKGEFESRLKRVIDGVKSSEKPVILFIDEAHTLVGAGDHAGGGDAANLLKPALARGELRTIAATTWSEYKKYFEKDAALARRFQPVKLDEPDIPTTALILRGLKLQYETSHKVIVREDAIDAAAELAARYITGRFLPDKAVDLLDTACARVKVNQSARPAAIEDCERSIQALERRKKGLERDQANGIAIDQDVLRGIAQEMEILRNRSEELSARWQQEKKAAETVLEARKKVAETTDKPENGDHRKTADEATAALRQIQDGKPLFHLEVDPDIVAKVVSDWTGIPLGKVMREQSSQMLSLEANLRKRIRGQDEALKSIAETIRAARSGLRDPRQPQGIFLLVGPSGVGKTETGVALADIMFGGERSMVTINMSEFQEKHTVSRLIGSPPGYVGYGEGGMLTEAIRQKPYSVVLLDEVEKAHPEVLNLFYQVFDKGRLSDSEGREIDCSNTVIILTSNLGTDIITEAAANDMVTLLGKVRPMLSHYFKPALLARMTVLPYHILEPEVLQEIIRLKFGKLAERLKSQHKMAMRCSEAVIDQVTKRCTEVETGARNIDYIISANILPRLSTEILECMGAGALPAEVSIDIDDEKGFKISFREHETAGGANA
jgi:type VI secretion system protein VasG